MGKFGRKWVSLLLVLALTGSPGGKCRAAGGKYLALTFDDGPSGQFTERLLQGLEERGAKATFFLCGYRVEIFPELPKKILAGGHEIGLHGYSHDPMDRMSEAVLERELVRTGKILLEVTGQRFSLLRPPGGCSTDQVVQAAKDRGLSLVFWNVDPRDWATEDRAAIAARVEEKARDGDIILLHDMSDSSVDAALALVDELTGRGFRFVTVSELARLRGKAMNPGESYYGLPG